MNPPLTTGRVEIAEPCAGCCGRIILLFHDPLVRDRDGSVRCPACHHRRCNPPSPAHLESEISNLKYETAPPFPRPKSQISNLRSPYGPTWIPRRDNAAPGH